MEHYSRPHGQPVFIFNRDVVYKLYLRHHGFSNVRKACFRELALPVEKKRSRHVALPPE